MSPPVTNKPKAYVNWILFDEQFQPVASSSGFDPVDDNPDEAYEHINSVNISQSGYLYVYCSNESNVDVLFDNLQVVHTKGALLETTHYYPFGLTMAGISDNSIKSNYSVNKFRYNGKELQHQEFSDGSGLEGYDYGARMQDFQLGKWWSIDAMSDESTGLSPYVYGNDNPVNTIDIGGKYAVSVHYSITYDELRKLGCSNEESDLIAHYASTYSDHPSGMALFLDGLSHPADIFSNPGVDYRSSIDYSKTAESQDEKNSSWHSMMSDEEAENGMTEEQAVIRGLHFGWDNIFASASSSGVQSIEHLGQGLHALQDAIAHEGVKTKLHLGKNWSSFKNVCNDAWGSTGVAANLTRSALLVTDVLKGKNNNLKDGDILDLRGMSTEQFGQFLNALLKQGFTGKITNQQH